LKRIPTKRKWLALSLVAVVIPISLLLTFRLTGILSEPLEPETIALEAVSWQMDRPKLNPYDTLHINEIIKNGYSGNYTSMEIGVHVWDYVEDWSWIPFEYRDGITFTVNVTATAAEGRVESVSLRCYVLDADASVEISTVEALKEYNVKVTKMRCYGTHPSAAYVEAEALGSSCGLFTQVWWIFDDENSEDHTLKATSEILYHNGTTYHKIVVPIILQMPIST
jgi:hypothetical protein